MISPVLRVSARWLFPVTAPPIRDGALLVDGSGHILAVGPDARVPRPASARMIELGNAALLPGLVNVHAHPGLTAFRGLLEDLAFPDWIARLRELRRASADDTFAVAARWACVESIAAGVTTVAATEDTAATLDALLESGMRGVVYREVFGPAPEQAGPAMDGLRLNVAAMRARETSLVRVGISPHAPISVSDTLFQAAALLARQEGLPIAVHIAESADEREYVMGGTGPFADRLRARGIPVSRRARSSIALLERTGVLDAQPLLIHCVRVDVGDLARIANAGASIAHCPAANARLGHGIAPVCEMLDLGISVGLGTDSMASNNRLDLLEEARLAQMLQRASLRDARALPSERLLRLATIDGARALGLDAHIGSLEPGKEADLCGIALDGVHVQPLHDPTTALFHSARASDVVFTAVRGRILHGAGRDVRLGNEGLRSQLEAAAERACAALG